MRRHWTTGGSNGLTQRLQATASKFHTSTSNPSSPSSRPSFICAASPSSAGGSSNVLTNRVTRGLLSSMFRCNLQQHCQGLSS